MKMIWPLLLVAFPAWAQLVPSKEDYQRVCPMGNSSEKCQRLSGIITQQIWLDKANEARRAAEVDLRDRGCVMLTDRVLTSNPPQFDWVCPP